MVAILEHSNAQLGDLMLCKSLFNSYESSKISIPVVLMLSESSYPFPECYEVIISRNGSMMMIREYVYII